MPFHGRASNNQDAVLWRRIGSYDDGRPVVDEVAEDVECHWDDRASEMIGPDGNPVGVDATVMGIDEELPVGSMMCKGTIASLQGANQTPTAQVLRIVAVDGVPDWRGRDTEYVYGLKRFGDALPPTGVAGT